MRGAAHAGTLRPAEPHLIPYLPPPVLDLGPYRLTAFHVLVALAVATEYLLVLHRAPRSGLPVAVVSRLLGWTIAAGLVGAHVFDQLLYYPERLRADPLSLLRVWENLSSLGGMLFGLAALAALAHRERLSWRQGLALSDLCLYALPFTLAVGRLGCALQHDHLGRASSSWLAVRFPDGPRFDCGLLEFLACVAIAGGFVVADRKPRPVGWFSLAFFAAYGPVRFGIDALRVGDARYLGWTPAQYLCAAAAALAWVGLLRLHARARAGSASPG